MILPLTITFSPMAYWKEEKWDEERKKKIGVEKKNQEGTLGIYKKFRWMYWWDLSMWVYRNIW